MEQPVKARCQRQTQLCSPDRSLGLLGLRPQPAGTPPLQAKSVLKFGTRALSTFLPHVSLTAAGSSGARRRCSELKQTRVSLPLRNLAKLASRRQHVWARKHVRRGY